MLGRGTRLRENLFGPGMDKEYFIVFDYCQNFEFFNQNPKGVETTPAEPLSQRIFKRRLELLERYAHLKHRDPEVAELEQALVTELHQIVISMPPENFLVRPHREFVDKYTQKEAWEKLSLGDFADLAQHLSGLPAQLPEEKEAIKRFDLIILQLQLALLEGAGRFERLRNQVIEIASQLETKTAIPMVKAQLKLILEIQEERYWEDVTLAMLEDARVRLRSLAQFIDRQEQKIVYTDFTDELGAMREIQADL
jgi:type I restriction enzyme R subunit